MKEKFKKKITSIRTQIVLVIVFVCFVSIAASFFMNNVFLRRVYLKERMNGMLSAFNSIYDAGAYGSSYDSDFAYGLEEVSLRYNVDIIVSSPNGGVLITTQSEGGQLLSRMMNSMTKRWGLIFWCFGGRFLTAISFLCSQGSSLLRPRQE